MNGNLQAWLGAQIGELKDAHLHKVPRILQTPAGGRVTMDGKEVYDIDIPNLIDSWGGVDKAATMRAAIGFAS